MGMAFSNPPFLLGETLAGTDDDGNLINSEVLGTVYEFPYGNDGIRGNKSRQCGKSIKAIALRNTSGITLYGKRIGLLDETAGFGLVQNCTGYCATLADANVVIIDEGLATTGVADDDIFWGILEGPVVVLTSTVGADFNGNIAVGGPLVGGTASTTGNSTSGRVSNITLPGTTGATQAFSMARNLIGTALSARTTGETASDLLIHACIRL